MADAELGLEHWTAAIEEANTAIETGYRNWFSYIDLATGLARTGDWERAKAAMAEARRLNPKLSVKFITAYNPNLARSVDALRKVGLPEE